MLHQDELDIQPSLVGRLIADQFPRYAHLKLVALESSGSSNKLFKLGDEMLVRLPRQLTAAQAIGKEAEWLPLFKPPLPVAIPQVVALGEASATFPAPWSIVTWIPGQRARARESMDGGDERLQLAADLAQFIAALRDTPLPAAAGADERLRLYRGGSLAAHDDQARRNIAACRQIPGLDLDLDAAQALWESAVALPEPVVAPTWYHGDLVAENLLLHNGRLSGVLDFGGVGVGDPTVDLHGTWELFNREERLLFRQRLQVDDDAWQRGRPWALAIALMTFPYYWETMPERVAERLIMARVVIADV